MQSPTAASVPRSFIQADKPLRFRPKTQSAWIKLVVQVVQEGGHPDFEAFSTFSAAFLDGPRKVVHDSARTNPHSTRGQLGGHHMGVGT